MTLNDLILRVRSYTRDTSGSIFTKADIVNYLNEAIDRIQTIQQLKGITYLVALTDVPTPLPNEYHYLIAVYSASRCMLQDEQDGRAGTLMNEFETKLDELKGKINNGEIVIKDADGNEVVTEIQVDYITNKYFEEEQDDEYILPE